MTNDIHLLTPSCALYSALLSPQGKFLHDFFLTENGDTLFLETDKEQLELLKKRFNLYKLRSRVLIDDISDHYVVFVMDAEKNSASGQADAWQGGLRFTDPRVAMLGARAIVPKDLLFPFMYEEDDEEYELLRLQLGIPEAGKDLIPDRTIPLEAGLQDLNAISWTKGCYLGQELTARTRYRGEVRKRLLPVEMASESFDCTQAVIDSKGEKAGELYSVHKTFGIARLRLEKLKEPLFVNSVPLSPHLPSWMVL